MKILNDLEEKEKKALIIIAIVFIVGLAVTGKNADDKNKRGIIRRLIMS